MFELIVLDMVFVFKTSICLPTSMAFPASLPHLRRVALTDLRGTWALDAAGNFGHDIEDEIGNVQSLLSMRVPQKNGRLVV